MRTVARVLTTAAAAGAIVVAAGAPATAGPYDVCPNAEPVCVYIPPGDYPLTVTSLFSPVYRPITVLDGPGYCDPSTGDCIDTKIIVPGVQADHMDTTVATLHWKGGGVGIDGTDVTLYAAPPDVTLGSGLGLRVQLDAHPLVVYPEGGNIEECVNQPPQTVGPVTYSQNSCVITLVFRV